MHDFLSTEDRRGLSKCMFIFLNAIYWRQHIHTQQSSYGPLIENQYQHAVYIQYRYCTTASNWIIRTHTPVPVSIRTLHAGTDIVTELDNLFKCIKMSTCKCIIHQQNLVSGCNLNNVWDWMVRIHR